jgi:hypothetical protein
VNDMDIRECTHDLAVQILKNTGNIVDIEVKFLKEILPYFDKRVFESNRKQTCLDVSLKLAYMITNKTYDFNGILNGPNDCQQKTIELYSNNCEQCVFIKFSDESTCVKWRNTLNKLVSKHLNNAMYEYNKIHSLNIIAMNWLTYASIDQLKYTDNAIPWKPIFICLTNDSIYVFHNGIPKNPVEEFSNELNKFSLIATRLVKYDSNNSLYSRFMKQNFHLLVMRHGTLKGISTNIFGCVDKCDYDFWFDLIIQQIFSLISNVKEVAFCKFENCRKLRTVLC